MSKARDLVLYALLAEIRRAVAANVGDSDEPDHLSEIVLLVDSAEKVLSGIPIE